MSPVFLIAPRFHSAAFERAVLDLLPEGVMLMVEETSATTPSPDLLLSMSIINCETPPLQKLKQYNSKAWYRSFERKVRK